MRLNNAALHRLPSTIRTPRYDRGTLRSGILHIGLGNFHRAHQSWYLHRLFDQGLCHDWAIIGAGVRRNDAIQRSKLLAQDCLTTLIELNADGTSSAEIVGSMIDYIRVEDNNRSLIDRMADPSIRIVALTVTEGGYYIDPVTGGFDAEHPDIRHDSAYPESPRTCFGAMVAALKIRKDADLRAFAGQSCDNLQGNGKILRQTVVSLARLSDPDLADWIGLNCSFPNSMVDCIVPATGPKELGLARSLGIDDMVPVTHERFRQWVIEDDFCAGRPDWDKAGATFSNHVHDYEMMKIRLLNAGHQIIANPGEILAIETISGCIEHPLIRALFRKVEFEEISPHIDAVPGMTPTAYVDLIEDRFSNSAILDTSRRVAYDGSSRHTGFVLPTLRSALAAGAPIEGLSLVEALWARMCEGTREDGSTIEPNDPFWDKLTIAAKAAKERPRAWLEQQDFYGNLIGSDRFVRSFEHWLRTIWAEGCEVALSQYTSTTNQHP